MAFVTYNTLAKLHFTFDKHSALSDIEKDISSVRFTEGITSTGDALKLVRKKVLSAGRKDAAKVLFLVTDGQTNNGADPLVEAQKIKDIGVWIITVGITDKIDE